MEKSLIFGTLIGGAAVAALYIFTNKKKTYVEVNKESTETEEEVKDQPITKEVIEKKVKEAGKKMAEWILKNKDYIDAAGVVVSFMASLYSLRNAINPKKPKGLVTMNRSEFNDYMDERLECKRQDILNDFFDDMFESGGRTFTNSDGIRQLIITTRKIGESA